MNRREVFKRLLGALSLPFAALLPQDRIRYLGKEDCKQMDAPLPPEPEYTTGYLQVVDTPSSWTSSTSTGNSHVSSEWRFFIKASEDTSLGYLRDEPDLYESQA